MSAPEQQGSLIGRGEVNDPIRGRGGECAVKGCAEYGRLLRITEAGYAVMYCSPHELEASRHFDRVLEA